MKEADIRPQALFNRYLDLVKSDNAAFFGDGSEYLEVDCPGCGASARNREFDKDGFSFRECADCGSLYLSPRPSGDAIARYYRESESVRFWGTEFYRETAEARREKLFRPRARDIAQLADAHGIPQTASFCDIGPGYGLLLEEVAALGRFARVGGVEPAAGLAARCRDNGFDIVETTVEDLPADVEPRDIVTAFEVLEHVTDPDAFLAGLRRLVRPGGIVLMTTLTADGFDIQTLWNHAKCIYAPHHVNLLSVAGYRSLLDRAGFDVVEIATPGQLDVDIVRNTITENPDIPVDPFVRRMVNSADTAMLDDLQNFLSRNLMSSHIRMIATLKETA